MMDPKQVVRAFVDAHNAHDIDAMMALLAEDSVMIDVAAPIPLDSKQDVRKLFGMIFAAVDINFAITEMICEGDRVFAAIDTTGVGTGTWMGRDMRECSVRFETAKLSAPISTAILPRFRSNLAAIHRRLICRLTRSPDKPVL